MPAVQVDPPTVIAEEEKVVKPQWKASIDFKWIRDNKDLVASNIENRKSGANLDLVLQLYDKMLSLQKIAGSRAASCGKECSCKQDEREAGTI